MDSKTRDWKDDEISLSELWYVVRRAKWLILACPPLFAALAYGAAHVIPERYEASIVVSPVSDSTAVPPVGGINSLAERFGGLASLAGVSIASDSKKAETLAFLQSQALTERYIQENNLLPVLFSDQWDPRLRTWKTTNPKKMPSLWKANQYFKKHVRSISTDTKTGLVTMTITWSDPSSAAQWANGLVKMTNDYLRGKAIAESQRDIAYLSDQASKTDLVGVRQVIYELLENEINKVMLARGSDEYALKIIDPAQPPERPSFPDPLVWTPAGFLVGILFAFIIALFRQPVPKSRTIEKLPKAVEMADTR